MNKYELVIKPGKHRWKPFDKKQLTQQLSMRFPSPWITESPKLLNVIVHCQEWDDEVVIEKVQTFVDYLKRTFEDAAVFAKRVE